MEKDHSELFEYYKDQDETFYSCLDDQTRRNYGLLGPTFSVQYSTSVPFVPLKFGRCVYNWLFCCCKNGNI